MNTAAVATPNDFTPGRTLPGMQSSDRRTGASAVSWGAVAAGAAAAAALSLILLILGTGLGLSSVSPWAQEGVSAATFGVSTILWLTFTQLAASGAGGYLAGRLRTKWSPLRADEDFFRDTAHGFLAWAVASLATAALLASVIGSIVNGGVQAGAAVSGGVASTAIAATATGTAAAGPAWSKLDGEGGPLAYFIDSLFRKDVTETHGAQAGGTLVYGSAAASSEVARIFVNTLQTGALSSEDTRYAGQLVAQRTGLSQQDAEKRVSDVYARAQTKLNEAQASVKAAADQGRKVSAYAALWLFVSLLIGAFIASLAATLGGHHRDA